MHLPWMDQPIVSTVLSQMLDRLDRIPLAARTNAIHVKATPRSLPELYGYDDVDEVERAWRAVQHMQDVGWITIKTGRQKPGRAPYEWQPITLTLVPECEAAIRELLQRPQPGNLPTEQHAWNDAVDATAIEDAAFKERLKLIRLCIEGRSHAEVIKRLALLPGLVGETLYLREVSSRMFWGLSKVLDDWPETVAFLLGRTDCPFAETPVRLDIHVVNADFAAILFVENPTSYEALRIAQYRHLANYAIIEASGFMASAKRVRRQNGASLHFSVESVKRAPTAVIRLENWLFQHGNARSLPVWFWGDLDYAGMRILKALRQLFPGAQAWQPGYAPMAALLKSGHGHLPEEANKAGQTDPGEAGCPYADHFLLPLIREKNRFVDQEGTILDLDKSAK